LAPTAAVGVRSPVATTLIVMLQGGEIIIILLVALVVLGPTRLPELAKKLGEWTSELRAAARDIRRGLEDEVADIKKVGEDLKAPLDELKKSSEEVRKDIDQAGISRLDWNGPKPVSGPTPADAMADLEEIEKKASEEGSA
jgi:Tat protein translocase TatB subunit